MPRHRHAHAYLALVLEGGYVERGGRGRWQVEPGEIVCHGPFEAHDDIEVSAGTRIFNLALATLPDLPAVFTIDNPDDLLRLHEGDTLDANDVLRSARASPRRYCDWIDELADHLVTNPIAIGDWCKVNNRSPAYVSRAFSKTFGTSPAAFRLEAQVQQALRLIDGRELSLAGIAAEAGFADQAHMTRAVKAVTGQTPGKRQRVKSIQDR
ncbi:helix-turn-helix domain-containing protein [Qipengyuania qiaonensis]|uniref:AraC family transcriptional regulator n=1 Tax=Qipengyuania qiaonensis TaxID=2867240 RepID=A0ABS7J746_9SPHN|nr:AraC family transcriptional regulator [Qipengyuania qiaonensis]MBX7482131.1 AraC family transcriptional regulator [Qipengyuania qiaonensis]